MKKTLVNLILVMTLLLLVGSACGGGDDAVSDADAVLTQAAEIAAQAQTQTAEAQPPATVTSPPMPTDTATLLPVITPTSGMVPTNAFALTASPGAGAGATAASGTAVSPTQVVFPPTSTIAVNNQPATGECYKAAFESDGPPSDGTMITGGKTFTKNWRIKNIGTCEWTADGVYLKWLGTEKKELNQPWEQNVAEIFGQGSVIPITTVTVYPGEHLDIKVDFVIPVPRTTNVRWKGYFCLGTPGGLVYFNGGTIWFDIIATNPD